jgi:hypothetical protein
MYCDPDRGQKGCLVEPVEPGQFQALPFQLEHLRQALLCVIRTVIEALAFALVAVWIR